MPYKYWQLILCLPSNLFLKLEAVVITMTSGCQKHYHHTGELPPQSDILTIITYLNAFLKLCSALLLPHVLVPPFSYSFQCETYIVACKESVSICGLSLHSISHNGLCQGFRHYGDRQKNNDLNARYNVKKKKQNLTNCKDFKIW